MPSVAEGLREVVGVAHAGGVDDAGHAVEADLVEVRDGQVERRLVEQFGEHLLVELGVDLAASQRHLGDRAHARRRAGSARSAAGEITPRRAACARSKREVCVGNRSVTWRAISAPVAVMPMKIGPVQARIAALVFSPSAVCASSQITIV